MTTDVIDLRDFYASSLGRIVKSDLEQLIGKLWPCKAGEVIIGLGYAAPFLDLFDTEKNIVLAFMPAQQGVVGWPSPKSIRSSLVEEDMLPLKDKSVDKLLFVHALENCHNTQYLLREAWRVLAPNGKMLLIAPNRRGLWARSDHTPFGHGQPYTMTQLSCLLQESLFTPVSFLRGLYTLPSSSRFVQAVISPFAEKTGQACLQKFSGIVCIEAVKQVYAGMTVPTVRKRIPLSLIPSPSRRPMGA
ncbi:MAG: class I SAM-dependent methyltransferase [Alphaproteobacteria bacterium]|nr:class I SAM-dependent methyltransferase [Alphaproteobacteria bacterium]